LILVDIEHLKSVNDKYGHLAADAVLREVARRLDRKTRSVDRVMRYSGEGFVILMLECGSEVDRHFAEVERLRPMRCRLGGET